MLSSNKSNNWIINWETAAYSQSGMFSERLRLIFPQATTKNVADTYKQPPKSNMAFRPGGTSWQSYHQGLPSHQGSPAERAQAKAMTISEQERLIEQKKKEIQQKMAEKKKKEEAATGGAKKTFMGSIKFNIGRAAPPPPVPSTASVSTTSTASPTPAAVAPAPARAPSPTDAVPKAAKPVGNIFSNDGSFLEQFRKMQQQKGEKSEDAKPASPKPNLSDIPLPDPPKSVPPPVALSSTSSPALSVPVQPIAFSTALSHTRKSALPVPKPSAFRDSDDEDDNALASILPPDDPELLATIHSLAQEVAEGGLMVEETAKKEHKDEELYRFLFDHDCPEHKYYQKRLVEMRLAKKIRLVRETRQAGGTSSEGSRKRKSRWMEGGPGDGGAVPPPKITIIAPGSVGGAAIKLPGVGGVGGTGAGLEGVAENDWGFGSGGGVSTSSLGSDVNRAGMIGTTELSAAQMKQLKEQQEMQRMVDSMVKYHNKIASAGRSRELNQSDTKKKKNRYAYDSDEDTEGGTWEHKQRMQEMQETKERAEILTQMGRGKHHLGDFLPPDELEKFLETLQALKEGRTPDFSDYQKFKIQADNIGYQMLKKLGWEEGKGLGSMGQGITAPVNKGSASAATTGLGIDKASNLTQEDAEDEFSAYRKRMMLAYRFRPNPLNNPRRPYY